MSMTTIVIESNHFTQEFLMDNSGSKMVMCSNFDGNEVIIITPYNKYQMKIVDEELIIYSLPKANATQLVNYEEAKQLRAKGYPQSNADFYYYNNTAWDRNEPFKLMSGKDARYRGEETKWIAFIDFEDTYAAPEELKADVFLANGT